MTDREQTRRDEQVEAFHRSWEWIPLQRYDDVQKPAEQALTALLTELDQAERFIQQIASELNKTGKKLYDAGCHP